MDNLQERKKVLQGQRFERPVADSGDIYCRQSPSYNSTSRPLKEGIEGKKAPACRPASPTPAVDSVWLVLVGGSRQQAAAGGAGQEKSKVNSDRLETAAPRLLHHLNPLLQILHTTHYTNKTRTK